MHRLPVITKSFALAGAATLVAFFVALWFGPAGCRVSFCLYLGAAIACGYLAGPRAGLVCTALALVLQLVQYRLLPTDSPLRHTNDFMLGALLFAMLGILTVYLTSEVRRALHSAARAEDEFFALANNAPVGVMLFDRNGSCHHANPICERLAGFATEGAHHEGWLQHLHPDDRAIAATWLKQMREGLPCSGLIRFLVDDQPRWVNFQAVSARTDQGTWLGHVAILEDAEKMHDLEEANQTLREDLERLSQKDLGSADELQSRLAEAQQSIAELTAQLADRNEELERAREQARKSKQSAKDFKEQLETVNHNLDEEKALRQRLSAEYEERQTEWQQLEGSLRRDLADLDNTNDQLRSQLDRLKNQAQDLEAWDRKEHDLLDRIAILTAERDQTACSLQELSRQIAQLESARDRQNAAAADSLNSLRRELAEQTELAKLAEEEHARLQQALTALQDKYDADLDSTRRDLNSQLACLQAELDDKESQRAQLEVQRADACQERERADAHLQDAFKVIAAKQQAYDAEHDERLHCDEARKQLQDILDRLHVGVLVLDAERKVRWCNSAALRDLDDKCMGRAATDLESALASRFELNISPDGDIAALLPIRSAPAVHSDALPIAIRMQLEGRFLEETLHRFIHAARLGVADPDTIEACCVHWHGHSALLDALCVLLGRPAVEQEPIDIAAIAAKAAESVRVLLHHRGQCVEAQTPLEPLLVQTHAEELTHALTLLLQNAVGRSPENSTIQMSMERVADFVRIGIRDHGISPAPEELSLLNSPRSDASAHSEELLGVYLARRILEKHGGRLTLRNIGTINGLEAVITLPLVASTGAVDVRLRGAA